MTVLFLVLEEMLSGFSLFNLCWCSVYHIFHLLCGGIYCFQFLYGFYLEGLLNSGKDHFCVYCYNLTWVLKYVYEFYYIYWFAYVNLSLYRFRVNGLLSSSLLFASVLLRIFVSMFKNTNRPILPLLLCCSVRVILVPKVW